VQSIEGAAANTYGFDANGNIASASSGKYRGITYTGFNLPDSQAGVQGPAGGPSYVWSYDEDHARIREVRTIPSGANAGTRTTWYLHPDNTGGLAFESEVNAPTSPSAANPAVTSNRHYLSAGDQSLGVLVTTGALPALGATQTAPTTQSSLTVVKLEYWHKDHLGSIAATTDHNGDVTARDAYDPFGKRRFANGNYDAAGTLVIDWSPAVNSGTDRGFTGHEQLDDIGLTHMNGRIYDAALGRFLAGDASVTDPLDLQSYNRYSYVRNDPLARTDPSGWNDLTQVVQPIVWITGHREWKCGESCVNSIKAMLLASAEQARKAAKHWRVVVPVVRSVVRFGGGMLGGTVGGGLATGCATLSGGLCSPLAPGIVLGGRWLGQEGAVLAFDAVLNATVGAEQPAEGVSTGASTPTSPEIKPEELEGKTEEELEKLAKDKGLVQDPRKAGKWRDPVSGKERLLIHPGHLDKDTGLPYDNSRAAAPHAHGFEPGGRGIGDPNAGGDLHFPIRPRT
jgi:RHS repeat-associated protein